MRTGLTASLVHGFDLSPALIEIARRRHTAPAPALAFEVADMAHAPPPALPYERLVSRLGVMFFNDAAVAFGNVRRWIVPGGRFAFAVWGAATDNAWMTVTRNAVQEVIDLPPVVTSAPGPFRYGDVTGLLTLLEHAGFVELSVSAWRGHLPVGGGVSSPAAAQFALASFSSFAEQLSGAGRGAFSRARRALTHQFAAFEQQGTVLMDAHVHIVTGTAGNRGR